MAILVPLFVGLFIANLLVYFSFRRWLKSTRADLYVRFFGSFLDRSIRQQLAFQAFLFKREYNKLDDPELQRRCHVLRAVSMSYLLVFALINVDILAHVFFR